MSAIDGVPPSSGVLVGFLHDRRDRRVGEVAKILGVSRTDITRRAVSEGALRPAMMIRWEDAARWLLEAWPLELLVATVGTDSDLLPSGFQPLPLVPTQPAYIVHALGAQWKLAAMPHRLRRPATFADYVTNVLHDAIDPSTVDLLRDDPEFMRAYDFPPTPGDER